MKAKVFETSGMVCPACPKLLERKLEKVRGVASAEADLCRGTAVVIYDAETTDEFRIADAIYHAGFRVSIGPGIGGRA